MGGGTEPNNNISQLCWVSPNLPSSNLSKVSRAIAFRRRLFSRLGGGTGTQQQHLSVMLGFTQPTQLEFIESE
ncbi:hypothetical protein [Limnospira fusiformis]|uniref:hypothetical protein n=1 Tax=Limnospira fusiformis TaxID=54297 RepID=UPI001449EC06|nr:hypothetical protein HFV01_22180 [Limnospira fusiformis SAG 85.79]